METVNTTTTIHDDNALDLGSEDGSNSASEASDLGSQTSTPATTPFVLSERGISRPTVESPRPTSAFGQNDPTPSTPLLHAGGESRSNSGIKDDLVLLHADELVSLAQRAGPVVKPEDTYMVQAEKILKKYLHYLWSTWTRCLWSLLVLPSTLADRVSMVAFAFFSSWILFLIMIWCLAVKSPFMVGLFDKWSKKYGGGLSMTNASYPSIFSETTSTTPYVVAAREGLSKPMISRQKQQEEDLPRSFNLDIAKLLFQCAALMYERTSSPLYDILETTRNAFDPHSVPAHTNPESASPGQVLENVIGSETAKLVQECLHKDNVEENEMTRFAARLGMKYATISELNSQTSASAGLFWDPKSTFIILAFKGTQPDEFVEWSGDFSYEPRDAGDWIRGFGKVHGGFLERVFPRKIAPGARVPYYTIRDAVRRTAAHLVEKHPLGTKINVWLTGHSLGTAIASLVYARAVNEPRDFGPDVVVRDAFMFAAPILCDVQSAHAFHNRMYHDERRTMWRITNANDCVATSLPDWGDDLRIHLSPYNLFSFSHLGIEVTMHSVPKRKVLLSGNAMPQGSPVEIHSIGHEEEEEVSETSKRIDGLTALPVVGRIISHGTAPYWDQLQRIQPGRAEWEEY